MTNLFAGQCVLGIDPGPEFSAYAVFDGQKVLRAEKRKNGELLIELGRLLEEFDIQFVGIEMIASYGMAVGAEVFETCVYIGRLMEYLDGYSTHKANVAYDRYKRKQIVTWLCGSAKAKDSNVRAALIDRIGPPYTETLETPIGKNGQFLKPKKVRVPGPTHGISGDEWAAVAVAAYAYDKCKKADATCFEAAEIL